MTVGERIKAARKKRGYTQKELGERAKIAEPTIRRYELGLLNPKIETLCKIAKALEVSVYYLTAGADNLSTTFMEDVMKETHSDVFVQFLRSLGYRVGRKFYDDEYTPDWTFSRIINVIEEESFYLTNERFEVLRKEITEISKEILDDTLESHGEPIISGIIFEDSE